jgi:small conductance mechanosensitive channel
LPRGIFRAALLRRYKVGDYVSVGGVEGAVNELGRFGATVVSGDSVTNVIGNNKVFSDTIKN